eukprot:721904-Pyramimonas_sp.AAC.1
MPTRLRSSADISEVWDMLSTILTSHALRWKRTHITESYSIYMVCGAPATSRSFAADWNVLGDSDSES